MLRRTKAILIMLLSFATIFSSFIIVSLNGAINERIRSYETFIIANSNYINNKYIFYLFDGIFFVGFYVFLMVNILLLKNRKIELVLNCFVNIVCFVIVCFFWWQQYYILMMIVVCACISINIILFSRNGDKFNTPVVTTTIIIMFLNMWLLCEHLIISMQWKLCGSNDVILNRIMKISRINVISFSIFVLPIIMILWQERKIDKRYRGI